MRVLVLNGCHGGGRERWWRCGLNLNICTRCIFVGIPGRLCMYVSMYVWPRLSLSWVHGACDFTPEGRFLGGWLGGIPVRGEYIRLSVSTYAGPDRRG